MKVGYAFAISCFFIIFASSLHAQTPRSSSPENINSDGPCVRCENVGEIQDESTCACSCVAGSEVVSGACCNSSKVATDPGSGTKTCCGNAETPLFAGTCCPTSQVTGSGISAGCCNANETGSGNQCCPNVAATFTYASNSQIVSDINSAYGSSVIGSGEYLRADNATARRICQIKGYNTATFVSARNSSRSTYRLWNSTANSFDSEARTNGNIYSSLTCSGVKCCPLGKQLSLGICCSPGTSYTSGICCADSQPFVVGGACSECNAADRIKTVGSTESDGCCLSTRPFIVNGSCSACNATGRTRQAGSLEPDGCCPDTTPNVIAGVCSDCDPDQHLESASCKENCTIARTTSTATRGGTLSIFTYDTISGQRLSCLEQLAIESYNFAKTLIRSPSERLDTGLDLFRDRGNGDYSLNDSSANRFAAGVMAYSMWIKLGYGVDLTCPPGTTYGNCYVNLTSGVTLADYEANKAFIQCGLNDAWTNINPHGQKAVGFGGGAGIRGADSRNNNVKACSNGDFVVDNNCKLIKTADVQEVCGSSYTGTVGIYHTTTTPISLLLDESYDINSHVSFVEFSLNPASEKTYWLWKGSAKTPLLVYDPAHTGKITSPTQLFGNWTFGGRKVASLVNSAQGPMPWKNGFEALQTIDSNSDGKVSGDELAPLALWFDENQDAISQPGEVRGLDTIGLKALFYKADKEDLVNHTIEASIGFARVVNGQSEYGKLIDWSSEGTNSQFELMAKHLLNNKITDASGDRESSTENNIDQNISKDAAPKDTVAKDTGTTTSLASGVWTWSLDKTPEIGSRNGMFIISADHGTKIGGQTLAELPISIETGTLKGEKTVVQFSELRGIQEAKKDGTLSLDFETPIPDGIIKNLAVVAKNGKEMTGSSTAVFKEDGKEKTVKYTWKAVKK